MSEKMKECMRAKGFSIEGKIEEIFSEESFSDDYAATRRARLMSEMDSETFAKQYGFGYSTLLEDRFNHLFQEENRDNSASLSVLEALPESEQSAFIEAAIGQDVPLSSLQKGTMDIGTSPGGCWGEALAHGSPEPRVDFDVYLDKLSDLYQRVDSDPEMQEMLNEWRTCIQSDGYTNVGTPSDLESIYANEAENLFAQNTELSDPEGAQEYVDLPEGIRSRVEKLEFEEIDSAVASYQCSLGFKERALAIQRDYELEFIRDNADELGVTGAD